MAKTIEDVKYCPKCSSVGAVVKKTTTERGNTAHVFNCQNKECEWFNTGWVIEVQPDGAVVERDTSSTRNKQYPEMTDRQKSFAQRVIDEAKNY